MRRPSAIWQALALAALCQWAAAAPPAHDPFVPQVPSLPWRQGDCTLTGEQIGLQTGQQSGPALQDSPQDFNVHCPRAARLQASWHYLPPNKDQEPQAEFQLQDARGTTTLRTPRVWGEFGEVQQAQVADYNGDGRPDLKLRIWYGGNGLASMNHRLLFFLSTTRGFQLQALDSMEPGLSFKAQDGRILVMHRTLQSAQSQDQRRHNYWVYRFVAIDRRGLHVTSLAPIWVMYTTRPHNRPTRMLSPTQRKQAEAALMQEQPIVVESQPEQPAERGTRSASSASP